jgi:hypothetical protein
MWECRGFPQCRENFLTRLEVSMEVSKLRPIQASPKTKNSGGRKKKKKQQKRKEKEKERMNNNKKRKTRKMYKISPTFQ